MHFNKSEAREKVTGKRGFCLMNFEQARFSLMPKCFVMKADTCPHFRKIMQLFPASRVSLSARQEEKESKEEEDESMDKREIEWDPLKEIYNTEQRMRSFRESGHRHSARTRARSRGVRTTPVGFLVRDDYKRSTAIVSIFFQSTIFFVLISPLLHVPSSPSHPLFLLLCVGKLLVRFVGIAFRC